MENIIKLGARIQRKRDGVISANRALDGAKTREIQARARLMVAARNDDVLDEAALNNLINARKRIQVNTDNANVRKRDVRTSLDMLGAMLGVDPNGA